MSHYLPERTRLRALAICLRHFCLAMRRDGVS